LAFKVLREIALYQIKRAHGSVLTLVLLRDLGSPISFSVTLHFLRRNVGFTFSGLLGEGKIKRASTTDDQRYRDRNRRGGGVLSLMVDLLRTLAASTSCGSAEFLSTVKPGSYEHITSVFPEETELFLMISKDPVSKIVASGGIAAGAIVQGLACLSCIGLHLRRCRSIGCCRPGRPMFLIVPTPLLLPWGQRGESPPCSSTWGRMDDFSPTSSRNAVVLTAVVFLMTSVGATLFPFVRKDLSVSPKGIRGVLLGPPTEVTVIRRDRLDCHGGGWSTDRHPRRNLRRLHDRFRDHPDRLLHDRFVFLGSRLYSRRGASTKPRMTELPPGVSAIGVCCRKSKRETFRSSFPHRRPRLDRCFRQVLGSGRAYKAQALILGGDIAGKGQSSHRR